MSFLSKIIEIFKSKPKYPKATGNGSFFNSALNNYAGNVAPTGATNNTSSGSMWGSALNNYAGNGTPTGATNNTNSGSMWGSALNNYAGNSAPTGPIEGKPIFRKNFFSKIEGLP